MGFRKGAWAVVRAAAAAAAVFAVFVGVGCVSAFGGAASGERRERVLASPRHNGHGFENPRFTRVMRDGSAPFFSPDPFARPTCALPVAPREALLAAWQRTPQTGLRITWLGHSTMLMELDGVTVLTDPVFSERASPFQSLGPSRFHPAVVDIEALPTVDVVVISHDHYDHLDMESIKALAMRPALRFVVPLGVGAHLEAWGVDVERITELDWYEHTGVGALKLVSTPAQHFSGRALIDTNATLWSSWALIGPRHRVFFSGDTGLTPQFADIGRAYGPFDVAMFEIGAFHPAWGDIHLGPDNALKAFRLINAGALWPIHWGTFNLGLHAWSEPIETLTTRGGAAGVPIVRTMIGAPVDVGAQVPASSWWQALPPLATTCPPLEEAAQRAD